MKQILRTLLGYQRFCLVFHVPAWSDDIQWYGLWCRPCGVYHGGDRRTRKRKKEVA